MLTRSFVTRIAAVSLLLLASVTAVLASDTASAGNSGRTAKPYRMIVLTDIGAEVDDSESMVRLLLYSDVIDLQGLIATTSIWKKTSVSPELIQERVQAYAKVHGTLLKHDPNFPPADALEALIKRGRPEYGMGGVGDGKDSEGSDWIIRTLEQKDERPLWITVWGGVNTLAQALYKLRATKPAADVDRLVSKLRVYTISDQDDSGPWIRKNFPKLFYIVTPGGDYGTAIWTGIHVFVPGIDNTTISNKWLAENIQQGHGPLGALYPDVAYGMEGDTPSWLGLIPNGLENPEHPDWGGWGGRYELHKPEIAVPNPPKVINGMTVQAETRPIWTNAVDEYTPPVAGDYGRATKASEKIFKDFKATLWRWRDDFQNDFAARMDWTINPYAEANHPPVPSLNHPEEITVRSGERFELSANATDPDGDSISFYWFAYPEAGSYKGKVKIDSAENIGASVWAIAPTVDKPETVHFILTVTDKGSPALSRYKRVIVHVQPNR